MKRQHRRLRQSLRPGESRHRQPGSRPRRRRCRRPLCPSPHHRHRAVRLATDDDLAIGSAVNDRSALDLAPGARILLRGESPQLTLTADPAAGGDLLVGSTVSLSWSFSDPLGLAVTSEDWSLAAEPEVHIHTGQPGTVVNDPDPYLLTIPGTTEPGPVTFSLMASDLVGRSVTDQLSWTVLANQAPTGHLALAAGAPGTVAAGFATTVTVHGEDVEGLANVQLLATGPATDAVQSAPLSGTSGDVTFTVAIAQDADGTVPVDLVAQITDSSGVTVTTNSLQIAVTADQSEPTVAIDLDPASGGDLYTAGNLITITVTGDDDVTVSTVSLTVDGNTNTSGGATLTQQWTAPAVSETTTFDLLASASDPTGNTGTATRTITIQPLDNANLPTISFVCPASQAILPGGYDALQFEVLTSDDIGVARVEFFAPSETTAYATVTPAAGTPQTFAASGLAPALPVVAEEQLMAFRARVFDASNNYNDAVAEILVVPAIALDPAGNNDWAALSEETVFLSSGTLTMDTDATLGDLIVLRGASISHAPVVQGAEFGIDLDVTGRVYIECGGSIDVTGKGYAGSISYTGAITLGGHNGGSHIGRGGTMASPPAASFGSLTRPSEAGGGSWDDGYGGGIVRLQSHSLVCDGAILANGVSAGSGGAGGSVWITTTAIGGAGYIAASGGGSYGWGNGGGGAIAVEYSTSFGSILADLRVFGGEREQAGGAGSIWLHGPGSLHGDMIFDNNGLLGANGRITTLPELGSGIADLGSGGGDLVTGLGEDVPAYFVGHWVELVAVDGSPKGTRQIAAVSGDTLSLVDDTGKPITNIIQGDRWQGVYRLQGVYRFDTVTVRGKGLGKDRSAEDRLKLGARWDDLFFPSP